MSRDPLRIVACTLGLLFALSGFIHGCFAALQAGTPGYFFEAIGPAERYWVHGEEPAFTLMPTFLATGIGAMVMALAVAAWSIFGLHRRGGAHVFLLLMGLLTLTGGGLGHIVAFVPVWAWATRITSELAWWRRRLSDKARIGASWPWLLGLAVVCWLIGQHISVFGRVPGLSDPDTILYTCWAFLLTALALMNLAFVAAIAARLSQSGPVSGATPGSRYA